ncbi:hypothetical protein [Streptomyces sp. STCH 565 A]|nr:hypothetical protein [Streptomyces sp. STCH 565 A]MCM8548790.1 hypothetical protein [Streptomyces sp. STCH 565 A]
MSDLRAVRRLAIRLGRKVARYAGPVLAFTVMASVGFLLVGVYLLANP